MNQIMFRDWTVREWTRQSIKEVIRNVYENMSTPFDKFRLICSYDYLNPCSFYLQLPNVVTNHILLSKTFTQIHSSTALTSLGGNWYPLDVIPLFTIDMATPVKAEDLQFETTDYKLVKKLLHFSGLIKPSSYPSDYPLPTSYDLECLVLYTSKFNITNNMYAPTDSGLGNYDTGIPTFKPRHNQKIGFVFNKLMTNQFYDCVFRSDYEFIYPTAVAGAYDCLPLKSTMHYVIKNIINRSTVSDWINGVFPAIPYLFEVEAGEEGYNQGSHYAYNIYAYPRLAGVSTAPVPSTRNVVYNSTTLTELLSAPRDWFMSLSTDDFLLVPDPQNTNNEHLLTRGTFSFFNGTVSQGRRPPVKAIAVGDQIPDTFADWTETYTY